jgi:hypothetical protein
MFDFVPSITPPSMSASSSGHRIDVLAVNVNTWTQSAAPTSSTAVFMLRLTGTVTAPISAPSDCPRYPT